MTPLAIVAAVALNGVIGRDNGLAWRLKTDMRRFRDLTWGKPMLMGRRTWDSIGKPLPGRQTVVLTRDRTFSAAGAHVAHDWDAATRMARGLADDTGAGAVAIVGGAEIYRLALPEADHLHLTLVEAEPEGDAIFPRYEPEAFREAARIRHEPGPGDEHAFTFVDFVRIGFEPPAP